MRLQRRSFTLGDPEVSPSVDRGSTRVDGVWNGDEMTTKGPLVAQFMDVHTNMVGVTPEALAEAHRADLAIQGDEGVDFKQAWADPTSGHVFCLSEAPDADAVRRVHERAGHPADEVHEITVTA